MNIISNQQSLACATQERNRPGWGAVDRNICGLWVNPTSRAQILHFFLPLSIGYLVWLIPTLIHTMAKQTADGWKVCILHNANNVSDIMSFSIFISIHHSRYCNDNQKTHINADIPQNFMW